MVVHAAGPLIRLAHVASDKAKNNDDWWMSLWRDSL